MGMSHEVLTNKLAVLMGNDERYTLDELHKLTGARNYMKLTSFRDRMRRDYSTLYILNDHYYQIEKKETRNLLRDPIVKAMRALHRKFKGKFTIGGCACKGKRP